MFIRHCLQLQLYLPLPPLLTILLCLPFDNINDLLKSKHFLSIYLPWHQLMQRHCFLHLFLPELITYLILLQLSPQIANAPIQLGYLALHLSHQQFVLLQLRTQ